MRLILFPRFTFLCISPLFLVVHNQPSVRCAYQSHTEVWHLSLALASSTPTPLQSQLLDWSQWNDGGGGPMSLAMARAYSAHNFFEQQQRINNNKNNWSSRWTFNSVYHYWQQPSSWMQKHMQPFQTTAVYDLWMVWWNPWMTLPWPIPTS